MVSQLRALLQKLAVVNFLVDHNNQTVFYMLELRNMG